MLNRPPLHHSQAPPRLDARHGNASQLVAGLGAVKTFTLEHDAYVRDDEFYAQELAEGLFLMSRTVERFCFHWDNGPSDDEKLDADEPQTDDERRELTQFNSTFVGRAAYAPLKQWLELDQLDQAPRLKRLQLSFVAPTGKKYDMATIRKWTTIARLAQEQDIDLEGFWR